MWIYLTAYYYRNKRSIIGIRLVYMYATENIEIFKVKPISSKSSQLLQPVGFLVSTEIDSTSSEVMLISFRILNSTDWWIYSETPPPAPTKKNFAFSRDECRHSFVIHNDLLGLVVSSSHISEKHTTLNVKSKEERNKLKFSKFLFMPLILCGGMKDHQKYVLWIDNKIPRVLHMVHQSFYCCIVIVWICTT